MKWNTEKKEISLLYTDGSTKKIPLAYDFIPKFEKEVDYVVMHEVGHVFARRTYVKDHNGIEYGDEFDQQFNHCSHTECYLYRKEIDINIENPVYDNFDMGTCQRLGEYFSYSGALPKSVYNFHNASVAKFQNEHSNHCYQHYFAGPLVYFSNELYYAGDPEFKQKGF